MALSILRGWKRPAPTSFFVRRAAGGNLLRLLESSVCRAKRQAVSSHAAMVALPEFFRQWSKTFGLVLKNTFDSSQKHICRQPYGISGQRIASSTPVDYTVKTNQSHYQRRPIGIHTLLSQSGRGYSKPYKRKETEPLTCCQNNSVSLYFNSLHLILLFSSPWGGREGLHPLMSHPMALAPRTAANEPSRPLTRNFALPFIILSTCAS